MAQKGAVGEGVGAALASLHHTGLSRALLPWSWRALAGLTAVGAVALLAAGGRMAWRWRLAQTLVQRSQPYEHQPPAASLRLLMVGDSTGVGTGATSPAATVTGQIARHHPHVQIVNRAQVGARFADIVRQLQAVLGERFDVILIFGGGNDVIRWTELSALQTDLALALQLARAQAEHVVLMPAGNMGNVPFFFPPWSWLMTRRSRQLHALIRQHAVAGEVIYVDGFRDRRDDPFALQAELHAMDGLHPSDAGYRLWFSELQRQADLAAKLAARSVG